MKRVRFLFWNRVIVAAVIMWAGSWVQAQDQSAIPDLFQDANASVIDARDLYFMSQLWYQNGQASAADLNGDNNVDQLDVLVFRLSYQKPVEGATPTPTPTVEGATPTVTPTPTIESATPTVTPTPTIGSATPTMTPTVEEITPTPTIEIIEPSPTPTETPQPTDTATPTETPAPTDTPTPDVTSTPTPTPLPSTLEEYFQDFDSISTFEEGELAVATEDDRAVLEAQGRVPPENDIIEWYIFNADEVTGDFGVALSATSSIGFNDVGRFPDNPFGEYENFQSSIVEINRVFVTDQSVTPRIAFDIAYSFEDALSFIDDFLVVEVQQAGSDEWEPIDLNGDGQIVNDTNAVGDPFAEGTMDAVFGHDKGTSFLDPITVDDFIHVEANLPKSSALRIALRFQSGSAGRREGAYIDNLRVYDAGQTGGEGPVITSVSSLFGGDIYADTETQAVIQGQNLTPVEAVSLTVGDQTTNLEFRESGSVIETTLPKLDNITEEQTGTVVVARSDGMASEAFTVTFAPAPAPVIGNVVPQVFYLGGSQDTITIIGDNFRPAFDGASVEGKSMVVFTVGDASVTIEPTTSNLNQLVIAAAAVRSLPASLAQVTVVNQGSGLTSNIFNIDLLEGSGDLEITRFEINVGTNFPVDDEPFVYQPATEVYPLQLDQTFVLVWSGSNILRSAVNVEVAGVPFVANGQVVDGLQGRATFSVSQSALANLTLSPFLVSAIGDVTASISIGNATPAISTFNISDPLPPVLYERDSDWASFEYLSIEANTLDIFGDNFRGMASFNIEPETTSQVSLIPENGEDEIVLEEPDASITALIADSFDGEDRLTVGIDANLVPPGTYFLRVLNPDSGLDVRSSRTVTFTP